MEFVKNREKMKRDDGGDDDDEKSVVLRCVGQYVWV